MGEELFSQMDTRRARRMERDSQRLERRKRLAVIGSIAALVLGLGTLTGALVMLLRPTGREKPTIVASSTPDPTAAVTATEPAANPIAADPSFEVTSVAPADAMPAADAVVADFDVDEAMRHVHYLADKIGVRQGGSTQEKAAASYIAGELEAMGYTPAVRSFPIPEAKTSQNVVATLPGTSGWRIVLGAHYDTKAPSPGANDNGTGSAALLAIARELADERLPATIEFVWFGTEEMVDGNEDHHHYGSRYHVRSMSSTEREGIAGMVSVDMIGYGPEFVVRTMDKGPQTVRDSMLGYAQSNNVGLKYKKDTGRYGWSDHEPFELAGIPAAWIEWRDDPYYHKTSDDAAHIVPNKVRAAGQVVLDWVRGLDDKDLQDLRE